MVKYYICDILSSFLYVNFTVEDAEKINSTKEMWCCDYRGCNEAFGDLLDSDSDYLALA